MRNNIHRRRDEGGFTIMESAASSFVLAIGVLGLVSTVVVQRQLEESTVRLWKSVGTATTAMEDLRANSLTRWSETKDWDQHKIETEGGNSADDRLMATVSDDPDALNDGAGMWSEGALAPNFYLVSVGTENDDAEFANSLKLQTYVANRWGLATGMGGGEAPTADMMASGDSMKMQASPTNVTVSGSSGDTLTFDVTNGSTTSLEIESATVQLGTKGEFTYVSVGGTVYYDRPGEPLNIARLPAPEMAAPASPGALTVRVVSSAEASGGGAESLTFTLTFRDLSRVTYTVTP